MRSTSNPAFRKLPVGGAGQGQYGPNVGFNQPQGGIPGYGAPQTASGADDRPMTVDDVVIKTGLSLGTALVTGVIAAVWAMGQAADKALGPVLGVMIGGMLVGLVLSLVMIFRQKPSGVMTLAYSAVEGVFLGAITGLFEFIKPGIALQAIIGTAGVFITMLVVYKTGAIKVTPSSPSGSSAPPRAPRS